jgi:beta-N-acetylhexosaminidase
MKRKAIITSLSGPLLKREEKILISKEKPWGIILFKRNIKTFEQTKNLINNIKKTMKDKSYPILIDEEGGTVTRLSNVIDNKDFSQKLFGDIYKINKKMSIKLYQLYIFKICSVLKSIGININTVPVLDILTKNTHKIIGSRSYSDNKKIIKKLSIVCENSYKLNKIATVIKHIPGHGCSNVDSHKSLPVVKNSIKKLLINDFNCFKEKKSFFAMTAHIIYSKLDSENVATHSKFIIRKIIRKKLGFKGIIISDDISMKALKHDLLTNAKKSLEAGCNLVLYCSGNHKDSAKLLKFLPQIDNFTLKKTSEFYKFLS